VDSLSLIWQRIGKYRALSALVLVAALVGGLLVANRQGNADVPAKTTAAAAHEKAATPQDPSAAPSAAAPSTEVAVQGKAQDAAAAAAAQAKAAEDAARKKKEEEASRSVTRTLGPPTYAIPAACDTYKGRNDNKWRGCGLLHAAGFGIDQMGPCLEKLWDKESHWNPKARNPSSGAYGIAQALPPSKMGSVGSDWSWNPETQIKWGLGYIKGRYKTPCAAWNHSVAKGWY
jgi:hypothetical protein